MAGLDLFVRARLADDDAHTLGIVAREVAGSQLAAEFAVDAGLIDVEPAGDILGQPAIWVGHTQIVGFAPERLYVVARTGRSHTSGERPCQTVLASIQVMSERSRLPTCSIG